MDRTINFDMDGTIANLYGVEDWLPKLRAHDPSPYIDATPLVRLAQLAYYINRLQAIGYTVNILSWLSKDPDPDYGAAVTAAKLEWLKAHMPSVTFNNIFIIPYGTPKHEISGGILSDDEERNRTTWNGAADENWAFSENMIFDTLRTLLAAGR